MGNRQSASNQRSYVKNSNRSEESRGDRNRDCGCKKNETAGRATSPSCSRYCSNVCRRLFPLDFTRCFNDCVSCQQDTLFETDHEFYED